MITDTLGSVMQGEVFQAEHIAFGPGWHDFMKTDADPSDTGGHYVCVFMGFGRCGEITHFYPEAEVQRGPHGSKVIVTF